MFSVDMPEGPTSSYCLARDTVIRFWQETLDPRPGGRPHWGRGALGGQGTYVLSFTLSISATGVRDPGHVLWTASKRWPARRPEAATGGTPMATQQLLTADIHKQYVRLKRGLPPQQL